MKILPKKQDIDKAKNDERKKEIDEGVSLATRIDKLREMKVYEENQLGLWRANTIRAIRTEIDDYITVRENLRIQTEEAEVYRKKLIIPLDKEWEEVNQAKQEIENDRESLKKYEVSLKAEIIEIKKEKEKISEIISKAKKNEEDTEKAKGETIALREMAQREYEIARSEHETQTELHEKELSRLHGLQNEYEIGINTNKIKEKMLEEKESEIIIREKHITIQQQQMKIIWEEIQKHGNSNTKRTNRKL